MIRVLLLGVFFLATPNVFADITFASSNFSALEDSGSISVSVDLSANCFGECYDTVSIDYSISGGTATSGVDFVPVSGQLSWDANGTRSFPISIISDADVEADETIIVTLNNCQEHFSSSSVTCDANEFTLSPITATATIINDDDHGTISLSNSTETVVEGDSVTVTVTRSGGSDGAVSIDFATADNSAISGQDYIVNSGTLNWADGESGSKSITLSTLNDLLDESNETFQLDIFNPGGGAVLGSVDSTTLTIENLASIGEISLDASSFSVLEGGQVSATVSRINGSSGAVSVDFSTADGSATAGSDYSAVSGTLTWADGESGSKSILLSTLPDLENEGDETYTLNLSNFGGGVLLASSSPDNAIVTIQNEATPGTISFDQNSLVIEEGGQVTATVTRSNGSSGAVSVDYSTANDSAIAGNDYSPASGTLNWADGESGSKTITIATLTDASFENEESFKVTLSNLVGAAELSTEPTATITIVNSTQSLSELNDLSDDQRSVAKALDEVCEDAGGDLLKRCQEILNSGLSNDQLKEVLDSIKPAQVSSQGSIAIDFGFQQLQVVHGRIVSLRNKNQSERISLAGFTVNSFGQKVPLGKIAQSMIYNGLRGASGDEPLRDSPLGFFIKGNINIGDKDSTSSETGFAVETKGITLGLDYQFTDELVLGVAGGYGHSDTDFDKNSGEMETHSGNFSIYGSYFLPEDFFIDWVLSYAINDYDSSRVIAFQDFKTSANSNPFGDQYGGSLGFGKDFYIDSLFISPYARVEYLRTGIDEYTESGGGGLALRIAEQSMFSLASTVGGQISQTINMPWGILSPGMRFEWRHQFRDDQRNIHAQFIDAADETGNFAISTDDPDRDYFNLGASLTLTLPEGRSAFIRYETRLGQNDITNHTVEASVRIPF